MKMNHYTTIGVSQDATPEEIKKSYRDRSKELHPDANNGDDKGFAELAKAYEVLSDPERRKKYDETGDDSSNNDAAQVSSIIANLTVVFLDHEDVKTKSLTEFIKKAINEQLKGGNDAIKKAEKEIENATNAKNRIKREKEGHNLILSVLENKIQESTSAIIRHKAAILLFKKVLEEIGAYSYLVDSQEERRYSSFGERSIPFFMRTQ